MLKSLRSQILLMVSIPIIGLLFVSVTSVMDKQATTKKFEILLPLAQVSMVASEAIHELQKERGKTVGMISSQYSQANVKAVVDQRTLSDTKITKFRDTLHAVGILSMDETIVRSSQKILDSLTQIDAHRQKADQKNLSVPENVKFYTAIIQQMIHLISDAVQASPTDRLTQQLLPYLALVQAKEASGLERAIGSALFNTVAQGKFSMDQFLTYYGKLSEETAFLNQFRQFANKEQMALFQETFKGQVIDQVDAWRKVLRDIPSTKNAQGIEGKVWFDTATQRINLMYSVEQKVGKNATSLATALADEIAGEQLQVVIIDLILLLAATAIASLVALKIGKGLSSITKDIRHLGTGAHDFHINLQGRQDEFGEIARSLEIFRKNAEQKEQLEHQALETQQKAEADRFNMMMRLASEFEQTVGAAMKQLEQQTSSLTSVSNNLQQRSDEGTSRSLDVAEASIAASNQVGDIANNGREMALSISEVAQKIEATTASMQMIVGEMHGAADNIKQLQTATEQIGNVVQMITDIAGQTNLLALNATIEAARAGEAGKGFAVVASEVKALSMQTEQATEQIAEEIKSIQAKTSEAVRSINHVEDSVKHADEIITTIASAVEEQSVTTHQMSDTLGQVAEATRMVTDEISYVCQSSASSCGTGIQVLWSVEDLKSVKQDIDASSEKFLTELKGSI